MQLLGDMFFVHRGFVRAVLVGCGQDTSVEAVGVVSVLGVHHFYREIHAGSMQFDGAFQGGVFAAFYGKLPSGYGFGGDQGSLDIVLFYLEANGIRPLCTVIVEAEVQILGALLAKHDKLLDRYELSELRGRVGALGYNFFSTHISVSLFLILEEDHKGQRHNAHGRGGQCNAENGVWTIGASAPP